MRHQNSVLHGLLKHVPWSRFQELVDEHGTDARVRTLSTKSQLVALLYAQLAGAASLREIEAGLESHASQLYHLGAREASRSTLADANLLRSHEVFTGLFREMAGRLGRGFRRHTADAVRLVDATGVKLAGVAAEWARFSKTACGAKAHIVYDPDAEAPVYLDVTPANVNDITAAHAIPIEPHATYVFDLGYYHYAWWTALDVQGCRFVTRLKKHTRLTVTGERPVQDGSALLYDRLGRLPERLSSTRRNPCDRLLREIAVTLEDGKVLRLVTNDLFAPAQEIADLYKRRWAIELFFRWVKQTLRIGHFLGRSENAVRIQIATALIAYLLIRLAGQTAAAAISLLSFARLVRANLMHKRPLDRLLSPPPDPRTDPRQLTFNLLAA